MLCTNLQIFAAIEVTSTSDSGAGSLRQAVIDAGDGDEITFSNTLNGAKITLLSSITIDKNLTITGNGALNTFIDGGKNDRVFFITSGTINISGVTIQNGRVTANNAIGGGIINHGTLTLTSSRIRGNSIDYSTENSKTYGGGIYSSGDLTLINCLVSGNSCLSNGGGINASKNLTLINTTITGNKSLNFTTSPGQTVDSKGGGIFFSGGSFYTLSISNSIIWGNYSITDKQVFGNIDIANNSIVEDIALSGNGNFDGTNPANNPMFVETSPYFPSNVPNTLGNYHLQINSPLLDKGNNTFITEITDLDGLPRIKSPNPLLSNNVDLGCYEYQYDKFVTRWKTDNPGDSNDNQIRIPIYRLSVPGKVYDFDVDWGDGSPIETFLAILVNEQIEHTYSQPGTYTVSISRDFHRILFNGTGDAQKLLAVLNWGNLKWSSMNSAFEGCSNLTIEAADLPNLTDVTDLSEMFKGATSVNSGLENWDVSSVTNMSSLFNGATNFNGDISGWGVQNVTSFSGMFKGATSFNKNIGGWNTASALGMDGMFQDATSFNRYIGNWDVSKVKGFMYMFQNATAFNQDIGKWDISGADSVAYMFSGATSFDQDLGDWNISNLSNFSRPASIAGANLMFDGVTLSTENYDKLLIGWNTLNTAAGETAIPTDIRFSGGNSTYCAGASAKASLLSNKRWTITDGGVSNNPPTAICKNITVSLDTNGNAIILPSDIDGGSYSCNTITLSISKNTFDCSNLGANSVILTVTDANQNTATCTSTVTIVDETAPTAVAQNLALDIVNGNLTITPDQVNNGSSDNCGIASMSLDKTSFDCSNIGENTVTLTVTDSSGNKDTTTATVTVSGIKSEFTSNSNRVCRNTPINFTDTSITYGAATVSSWNWDLGDGTTSNLQNPSHSYDLPGNHIVTLTTIDSNACQNTATKTISVNPPKANFVLSPATGSIIPHTVFFTDQSILPDTWSWDFGDGSTSTAQNPIHNYTSFGDFTAKLVVTDTIYGCSDSLEKTIKIAKPNSNFTSNDENNGLVFGCGPLTVNFEDTSTVSGNDTINSWLWDFGDGTTSTEQNPVYTYEKSGVYTVSLTTQLAITGF